MLVGVYHPQLSALEAKFVAAGLPPNSLGGPGSILCSFPASTQTNYGYLFFIEFFVCTFIVSPVRVTIAQKGLTAARVLLSGLFLTRRIRLLHLQLPRLSLVLHTPT